MNYELEYWKAIASWQRDEIIKKCDSFQNEDVEIKHLLRVVGELRGALQELRIRYHAAGRRPEECYEMSVIDDALEIAK